MKGPKLKAFLIIGPIILIGALIFFLPAKSFQIKKAENRITRVFSFNSLFKPPAEGINILVLGRPGPGYPGENLTDTIILVHLNPKQKKAVLISLPRDLAVKIPETRNYTKINQLYSLAGLKMTEQKIEEITGLIIDYYILVDLVAVKEIVDSVGGLNILAPFDINDPYFPGPNHSYQTFNLSAGWRYLDGETALKYVRTRYTSPNNDFDRMARQQQVIRALKQKTLSLNVLSNLSTYLKIFQSLTEHIQTDLSLMEMKSLYETGQKIEPLRIISLVLDKKETNLMASGQTMLGNQPASTVWPKAGKENYSEIKEFIKNTIN